MKNRIIQSSLFLMIIGLLTGCFETNQEYYQLTSDDLSHLYIDRDSLVYDGNSVNCRDTIAFLHNSMDTLLVEVSTSISDSKPPWSDVNVLIGVSEMHFSEQTGFWYAKVDVFKGGDSTKILINFNMLVGGCSNVKLDIPLDTALVLGKTYNNVYKFEYPDNSLSKLKCIYFAKKYGFIKVETADGRKLEKLEISKEEIRTILSDYNRFIGR